MTSTELKMNLEQAGICNHSELFHNGSIATGELVAKITEKIISQLSYNIMNNVPLGIVSEKECVNHAIKTGLVSAIGNHVQWDIVEALELCADILEDVNAHKEAGFVRKMIELQ